MANAETYGKWIVANADKKGTPEFAEQVAAYRQAKVQETAGTRELMEKRDADNAALERENAAAFQRKQEWEAAGTAPARLGVMLRELAPKALETVTRAGFAGGTTAVGQEAGRRVAGTPGAIVGGAVAGAMAELMQQGIDVSSDPNARMQPGRVYGAAIQGALSTQGQKTNAFANAAAETVHSLVDQKRFPELSQLSQAAATGYVAGKVSQAISGKALTPNEALYEYRYNTFRKLRPEGVVVNPAELKRHGPMLDLARVAAGGDANVGLRAIEDNQYILQALARNDVGLSKEAVGFRPDVKTETGKLVRKGELNELYDKAKKPYEELRAISKQTADEIAAFQAGKARAFRFANKTPQEISTLLKAGDNIDALKRAREDITEAVKAMKAGEDGALKRFEAAQALEDSIEGEIEAAGKIAGNDKILKDLKESRVKIAKIFALKNSVDPVYGLIDVQALDAIRKTDVKPGYALTGKLADIADFARAFSRNAQDAVQAAPSSTPGAAVNFTLRNAAQGKASGLVAAGVPLIGRPAQNYLMSPAVQDSLMNRSYRLNPDSLLSAGARNTIMQMGRGPVPAEQRPVPLR